MKKLLLFTAMFYCLSAFAQDVILKKDGSEIKAKVFEVDDYQIKYKAFDFQDGPTRIINISEVFMITFENGKKEVFDKQASTPTTSEKSNNTLFPDLKSEFTRIGSNDGEMLEFFRKNNFTEHYNSFNAACKQRNKGKVLLSVGIVLTAGGIVSYTVGLINEDYFLAIAGVTFIVAGEGLMIASIPISASAGARKRAIKNNFARENFGMDKYSYQSTLDFGLTTKGVGLTLNF